MKILLKRHIGTSLPTLSGLNPYEPLWYTDSASPASGKGKLYVASTASSVEGVMMDNMLTNKGDIVYASEARTPSRLGIGTAGQVLTVSSNGVPSWQSVASVNNGALKVKKDGDASIDFTAMTANQSGNTNLIFKNGTHTTVGVTSGTSSIQIQYNLDYSATGSSLKPIYIDNTGTPKEGDYTFPSAISTANRALVSTSTNGVLAYASELGTSTKPIYINSSGALTAGDTYAGGTSVTLNGTSKASNTASFYAPTSAGTSGNYLKSSGTGAPVWSDFAADVHSVVGNPMKFKGSIGTGGTSSTVPTSPSQGDTYKIIEGGTISFPSGSSSFTPKVGDTVIYKDSADKWVLIPSGDEPTGTVTSVGMTVPTGLSVSGSPITSSGTLAVSLASGYEIPTTAHVKNFGNVVVGGSTVTASASDYNDTLTVRGDQWIVPEIVQNAKTLAFSHKAQTAYTTPQGSATKVPQITTDAAGHVTNITEVTITQPTVNNGKLTFSDGAASSAVKFDATTANASSNSTVKFLAGSGITHSLSSSGKSVTYSHSDTSSQASVSNSGRTYIQSVTLDDFGHVTGLQSATESVVNTNQTIGVGQTTFGANDRVNLKAGNNVTLTPSTTDKEIVIAATDTVYTHPTHTAYNSGLYKITVDSLGHVTSATAVTKADITALGIPETNDTYSFSSAATTGKFTVTNSGSTHSVTLDEIDGGTW